MHRRARAPGSAVAARIWACCTAMLIAGAVLAQDYRILYYENVPDFAAPPNAAGASAAADSAGSTGSTGATGAKRSLGESAGKPLHAQAARWSFVAFGRQFDVEIEPNQRLLLALPPAQRARLRGMRLFSGRLAGHPGSWVRVARHRGVVSGAIWDGATLYGIDVARRIAPYAVEPGPDDGVVVFRWRDTLGVLRDAVRHVEAPQQASAAAPSDADRLAAMTSALPTPVGLGAQLDVVLIADDDLVAREGPDAEALLLAMVNVIDGIYVMQAGVHLNVAELALLDAQSSPSESDPFALLNELEDYKLVTPARRSAGLLHLFTGRDLDEPDGRDGDIVGVANIGVLCSQRFGVGLTQATFDTFRNALIAAHEIGHNFGAPHDGESGSPCEHESGDFLMASRISGSRAFSQCSLEQMAPEVESAACLTALAPTDVSIEVTEPPPHAVREEERFDIAFTIANQGQAPAQAVEVTIAHPGFEGPEFVATAADVTEECNDGEPAYCRFARLAAGEAVHYRLAFLAPNAGVQPLVLNVAALNDSDAANNTVSMSVDVGHFVDIVSEMDQQEIEVQADANVVLGGTITNAGVGAAHDVIAELGLSVPYEIIGVDADGAACAPVDGPAETVRCELGDLAAGESFAVSWTGRPMPELVNAASEPYATLVAYASESEQAGAEENNTARTQIVRRAAPPAPAEPPPGAGSGGGGGGAAGILALLALLAARRAQRSLRRGRMVSGPIAPDGHAGRRCAFARGASAALALRAVLFAALGAALASALGSALGTAHAQPADTESPRFGIDLPDAPGRRAVEKACTACHDLAGIAAFKGYWDRKRWAAMVATMIEHGAELDEDGARAVVDYLTLHFGRVDEGEREGEKTP